MKVRPAVSLVFCLAAGCARGERAPTSQPLPDPASVAAARAAANSLGADLAGMLTRALQEGSPETAIVLCADSAQVRTARYSMNGVYVRRIGTRVRNPANQPDSVESAVLVAFAAAKAAGKLPADTTFVATGPGGAAELHFLRPVLVGQPCLACHGNPATIAPAVRTIITARYPGDQATGYQLGDLRGAVSVRLKNGSR